MSALTHRQRAERAINSLLKQRWMRAFRESDPDQLVKQAEDADLIAREMFPRELVEAARKARRCPHGGEGLCAYCREDLSAAIALYPEPQEEPDHE